MSQLVYCGNDELATSGRICRWPADVSTRNVDLTYAIVGYIPQFPQAQFRAHVREAFDAWEKVCNPRFKEIESTRANLIITVARGRRNGFDGRGGVLAKAQLPCSQNPQQCVLWMDLDENWVYGDRGIITSGGIDVLAVLAHEIGHLLGFEHEDDRILCLMNRFYNINIRVPNAHDAARAVAVYGPSRFSVPVPEPEKKVAGYLYTDGTWKMSG